MESVRSQLRMTDIVNGQQTLTTATELISNVQIIIHTLRQI